MKVWKIYRVTGPTGKTYVGQTHMSVRARWNGHRKKHSNTLLSRAIRKHGEDMFDVEQLVSCRTQEDADLLEKYFIAAVGSLYSDCGYNIEMGGIGPGKRIKTHCLRGHEYAVVGQTNSSACRECFNIKQRAVQGTPEGREKARLAAAKHREKPGIKEKNQAFARDYLKTLSPEAKASKNVADSARKSLPESKAVRNAKANERYAADPVFRARCIDLSKKRQAAIKDDPDARERKNAANRKYLARKRLEKELSLIVTTPSTTTG